MYLHIFAYEKFTDPYIEFINKNFDPNEHLFLIIGKEVTSNTKLKTNIRVVSKDISSLLYLIKEMHKCKKIYLHGLFIRPLILLLYMQRWLLKKSNWIIFGGDLYSYLYPEENLSSKIYEKLRKPIIKNIGGIITPVKGDYELAKKWYGAKGEYYYSILYPSNLYKDLDTPKLTKEDGKKYIQIGNSADPTNNHLEIFEKLKEYKDDALEIICPLSYGNSQYRDMVINEGNKIFGSKFIPLTKFMPFDEYLMMLSKIDIAIFNHKRQQAVGNILTLISLGKKVYIRDDITTWSFCEDQGIMAYSINKDYENLFEPISNIDKNNNINVARKRFSQENLKEEWEVIFNENRK
ncbi:TDP-N-acetylfucosamine:lipid II N-acetylfucosaminyltransferase [Bacillus sp. RO3]|nr:TDP-N-acetylfucosamine:lipid II N-acetylfucosaminyltransferase [Bacillus sp. RO3]